MSQKHVILLDGSLKNLDKRRRRNVKEDASDVLGKARRSLASGTEIQKDEDPKISEHNWHLASASIQKLQFINSNGPFWKQNRQSQRLVRSHVMRGVRREQKLHSRSDNGSSASLGEDDATYQPKQIMSSQIRSSTSLQFGSVFPGSAVSFYGGGYPFVLGLLYYPFL
ncbi:hypothetical protein MMC18_001209 [Xylographa bjoerkii]|nr:hypothetical protein [Xylographa bjoerkii]